MPRRSARLRIQTPLGHSAQPASPFIKWVGGKGRLLHDLYNLLPIDVDLMRHVEPFVGGGALFFARQPKRALLSDLNDNLIQTYLAIRSDVEAVISELDKLARKHSEDHYYHIRHRYNHARKLTLPERAAMFVYLNKTCFNGLHRVNRSGEFNVPMGRYKNPGIVNPESLRRASRVLQHATIQCAPYKHLLDHAKAGDFVYLDPPYEPASETANFTAYSSEGFGREDQRTLCDLFGELDQRGCKLMLSNSDVPVIRELYRAYNVKRIYAPRAINCDSSKRGPIAELVVRNYD